MSVRVFTKRNALIGFITLKALERRRRRRQRRNVMRLGAFLVLGIFSLGLLAGLAIVLLRRQQAEPSGESKEAGSGIAGEAVAASTEPVPAT